MTGHNLVDARTSLPTDTAFIYDSWFKAYWKATACKTTSFHIYKSGQNALISRLLGRAGSVVAFSPEVPDEILGYAVLEYQTVHFVYVKPSYRKMGIGRGLIRGCDRYTQHMGALGALFAEKCGLQFDPYLAY